MEEDFEIGDVVEWGEDMRTGQIVSVRDDECSIEYFDYDGAIKFKSVSKNQIFKNNGDD